MLKSITFGDTIIGGGWYLQVQLLLYLFFLATFSMIKDNRYRILFVFGECILFCICLYVLKFPHMWFESVLAFPIGMLCRERDSTLAHHHCRDRIFVWGGVINFTLVCITFVGSHLIDNVMAALILKMVSAICFSIFVSTVTHLIYIENGILRWLGKYSTEIYLVQGVFLTLFHSDIINLENPYLYILFVTIFVLISSVAIHPITKMIYSIAREQ